MGKIIIYHHNDLDGRCAAAIMGQYGRVHGFASLKYIEVDYRDSIEKFEFEDIEPEDTVAVVDFSFEPEVMESVRNLALNVIWCDHHVTAKDYGYDDLLGVRDFTDKGLSGCECTWQFCFKSMPMPEAIKLIGDYDAWRLEMAPRCFEFYEGLKLRDNSPQSSIWPALLHFNGTPKGIELVARTCEFGRTALKYRDRYCEDIGGTYGYETELDGHKAFAMNLYRFGSNGFGDKIEQYSICIGYIHDGKKFTVGLYSKQVDVSIVAAAHGGGGHVGASGFVCEQLPFKPTG